MKTSVIEVHDMLSVLSVVGVEKRMSEVPGVESVTVNYAAGNATIRYDETRLEIADIKAAARQNQYESEPDTASAGDDQAAHVSRPAAPPAAASKARPAEPKPLPDPAPTSAGPNSAPNPAVAGPASAAPPGDGKQDTTAKDKD